MEHPLLAICILNFFSPCLPIPSLNGGIPGLFHPAGPQEVHDGVKNLSEACFSSPCTRPPLMHPRSASLFHPPRASANSWSLKSSIKKCCQPHTIAHLGWLEKEPRGLPLRRPESAEDPLASEPCRVPLWAVPQVVTNLSSRVSLSEGAGTPHLPWETLGFEAWLLQGRDDSWWLGSNSGATRSSSQAWVRVPDPHPRSRCPSSPGLIVKQND